MNDLKFKIKTWLSNAIFSVFSLLGLNEKMLTVLCYHSISESNDRYSISLNHFEDQVKKNLSHARYISLDKAMKVLEGKRVNKYPELVLTIDDGYEDVIQILPLTQKYKIPVTLFVLSNPKKANRKELNHKGKLLTAKQIKYLMSLGWQVGCHSATHSDFYNLTKKEIKKEIIDAKKVLERRLNTKIKYFAYPKGRFNDEVVQAVKEAGYVAAFAISAGGIKVNLNRWILPRTIIDKMHSLADFPAVFSPSNFFLRNLTDRFHIWERVLNV